MGHESSTEAAPRTEQDVPIQDAFVREYFQLLDEGWEPSLEEFLSRVPDELRDVVFQEIDEVLANREAEEEAPPPQIQSTAELFARGVEEEIAEPDAPELVIVPDSADDADPAPAPEEAFDLSPVAELFAEAEAELEAEPPPEVEAEVAELVPEPEPEPEPEPLEDAQPDETVYEATPAGFPILEACQGTFLEKRTELLVSAAHAVAAAHREGVLHGNLSPEYVIVTPSGEVTVLTPPPGERGDAADDVFAFGALMYRVLTEREPRVDGDPILPRTLDAEIPTDLEALCLACLSRNPRSRPNADDVAAELDRFAAGREVRVRPALYLNLLRRRIQSQLRAVRGWVRHGLARRHEADRLESTYRNLIAREERWLFDPARIAGRHVAQLAGTLLLVLGAGLVTWTGPAGPWPQALPGVAFAGLLAAGLLARRNRELAAAAGFLLGAVALAVPAAVSLLGETGLVTGSLMQLAVAGGVALAVSAVSLLLVPLTLFAWTTALLVAATYAAFLAADGALDKTPREQALWLLPLAALLGLGVLCESKRRFRWAEPCFMLGVGAAIVLPPLAALGGAAFDGSRVDPFLGAFDTGYAALAVFAVVLFVARAVLGRTESIVLRRSAVVFGAVAPVYLVGSLYLNALATHSPWAIAAVMLASTVTLAVSQRLPMLVTGLGGLALGCHLAIAFGTIGAYPLALGLLGVGAAACIIARR